MANNARILSAVLNKWAQPLIGTFLNSHIQSLPLVQGIQNKVRSMGWVSPNWSLLGELSPIMESVSANMVMPILNTYLSKMDDSSIPKMIHEIVDSAIRNRELSLFEGKVVFEESDLRELKRLLELNLPYNINDDVSIKTE